MSDDTQTDTTPPQHAPGRRGRRRLGRTLLVVGAILAPITMTSLFVRNIVLDTDRYVETVSPLGSDPAIRAEAVARITDTLMSAVDVGTVLRDTLPEQLQVIAGPVETAVRTTVANTTEQVMASEKFQALWDGANRLAHESIRSLLTEVDVVELPNGKVVVDLSGIAAEVAAVLVDRGLGFFANIPITQLAAQLELFDASQLESVQTIVSIMRAAIVVLVVLTLACLAGAVALAADRRRAVAHVGIALAIGTAVLMTVINLGRSVSLSALDSTISRDAAAATFDILTRFFRQAIRTVFGLGLVLVLGAWLAGPSRTAVRLRGLARSRDLSSADGAPSATAVWVRDHATALRVGLVAVVGVIAVNLERPSPGTVLVGTLAVLAGLAAISLTAAPTAPSIAAADTTD